jgi:phosphate acetyltransferase
MNLDILRYCRDLAQSASSRIVFPEGNEPRILKASRVLLDESICGVILLGENSEIQQTADEYEIPLDSIEIIKPTGSDRISGYAETYITNRPRTKSAVATRMVTRPLGFGAMMVKAGDADLMIAGVAHTTRRVIEAAGACIGLADGISIPSSFFIMNFANRSPLIFADCAVNVDPTAEQLADIAIQSSISAERLLGEPPKVALLSFSTKGSANHIRVDKIKQALDIVQRRAPDIIIDGELQVDSALVPSIAAQKVGELSSIAGDANVLIFPDLDAANIGYKLVKHLANAEAIGPILQGFSQPVADLSRGASVDEIINTAVVALALR